MSMPSQSYTFGKDVQFPFRYQLDPQLVKQFANDMPYLSLSMACITIERSRQLARNKCLDNKQILRIVNTIVNSLTSVETSRVPAALINDNDFSQVNHKLMATDPIIHFVMEW